MSDLHGYAEQAQTTLREAQEACKGAQHHLDTTQDRLVRLLPLKLELVVAAKSLLERQHLLLETVTTNIKERIEMLGGKLSLELATLITPALTKLDATYLKLKQTPVPKELLNEETDLDQNLADFISVDAIQQLKKNIAIYKQNATMLISKLTQLEVGSEFKQLEPAYAKLIKQTEPLTVIAHEWGSVSGLIPVNKYTRILEENTTLEHELSLLLEMLTNHYDQCLQALLSPETTQADIAVLRQDAFELPDVLNEVNQVAMIISTNCDRANKVAGELAPQVDTWVEQINDHIEHLRQYKVKLARDKLTLQAVEEWLGKTSLESNVSSVSPCQQYADVLSQLEYHYANFYTIYKTRYLAELYREKYEYPRQFLDKIDLFLNTELHQIHQEEVQRRKLWVNQYGEFIPKEFTLPGEVHIPVVSQVITECLDDVANEMKGGVLQETPQENRLLDFIKEMQIA